MKPLTVVALGICLLAVAGCEARTDKVDGGGVLLSITDFDGLPAEVSVSGLAALGNFAVVLLEEIELANVPKNPSGVTSALMNVETDSYEITFSRSDGGTILPPPLVQNIFGVTPVNGTQLYENLRILTIDQIAARPLADLLAENGGFDKETGNTFVRLNFAIRFFGHTLSGDEVDSAPANFSVLFVQ